MDGSRDIPIVESYASGAKLGSARELTVETHKKWVLLVRHLEQALALFDELDEGDGDPAAYAQRAVNAAKRELRDRFGQHAAESNAIIIPFPQPARSMSR